MPEPRSIDLSFHSYEVNDITVDHVLDCGESSSHAPSPVNSTEELG